MDSGGGGEYWRQVGGVQPFRLDRDQHLSASAASPWTPRPCTQPGGQRSLAGHTTPLQQKRRVENSSTLARSNKGLLYIIRPEVYMGTRYIAEILYNTLNLSPHSPLILPNLLLAVSFPSNPAICPSTTAAFASTPSPPSPPISTRHLSPTALKIRCISACFNPAVDDAARFGISATSNAICSRALGRRDGHGHDEGSSLDPSSGVFVISPRIMRPDPRLPRTLCEPRVRDRMQQSAACCSSSAKGTAWARPRR